MCVDTKFCQVGFISGNLVVSLEARCTRCAPQWPLGQEMNGWGGLVLGSEAQGLVFRTGTLSVMTQGSFQRKKVWTGDTGRRRGVHGLHRTTSPWELVRGWLI